MGIASLTPCIAALHITETFKRCLIKHKWNLTPMAGGEREKKEGLFLQLDGLMSLVI